MAAPCKHWIVHRQICCRCKSRVRTYDRNTRVPRRPSLFDVCPHRMYQYRLCCRCGYFLDIWDFARAFSYMAKSLRMSPEFEAATKQQKLRIGLGQRKLHLVLGLEHTLIDRISVSKLAEIDKYHLIKEADSGSRDDLFRLPKENFYSSDVLVKFRPFVREFLLEAKEFFTMHVFTNYGPDHARKVVKLLDPHMIYFGDRIITSRDSDGGLKSLKLVLAEPRGVLIVDYEHGLWMKQDHSNLIMMSKYEYFKENSNKDGVLAKTLSFLKNMFLKGDNKVVELEGKREEHPVEDNRFLLTVLLKSLKTLHGSFFNEGHQDVVPVMPRVFRAEKFT